MNIIVEGVDCAGKSTLVKEIKNRLKYDVLVLGHQETPDQFRRYLKALANHTHMIFERSHISEVVYSDLFGRNAPFSPTELTILNQLTAQTCLVIHADPPVEIAHARYTERSGVYQQIQLNQLDTCINLFQNYMRGYEIPNLIYQSRDWDDLENTVSQVAELI